MPPSRNDGSPQRLDDAAQSTAQAGPCLAEGLVLALATGAATERERATIELHLDSCDACQIQGTTLGSKLRREGRCPPGDVLLLAEQLASGLDAVHRMQLSAVRS